MRRGLVIWGALVICGGLIVAALGLLSQALLKAEKERQFTEGRAELEERSRLALSQMDGIAYGLLVAENQRTSEQFRALSSDGRLSPLVKGGGEFVRLYFEVNSEKEVSSPQVLNPDERLTALAQGVTEEQLATASKELALLKELLSHSNEEGGSIPSLSVEAAKDRGRDWNEDLARQKVAWDGVSKQRKEGGYQEKLSQVVRSKRKVVLEESVQNVALTNSLLLGAQEELELGVFAPVWLEEELFLVREVKGSAGTWQQGVWLQREVLEKSLLESIEDWLPNAQLEAVAVIERLSSSALVSLPWKLLPGEHFVPTDLGWTPLRVSLLVGWIAVVLSLLAVAGLMRGVMSLSERRADFVSSVTHELRTPLTTFRLYSGMMAEGMVTGEEKKVEYIETMRDEAERLHHLVENVLAYSRLERGGQGVRKEVVSLGSLLERCEERLRERVAQEDARLFIEVTDPSFQMETDMNAIEQILFNLVDNACKYGMANDGDDEVRVQVAVKEKKATIRVCDRGAGIRFSERRRLFRPFHKSAKEAASTKPGVGLGLSLCRRLARALGGDLRIERSKVGACFLLEMN